MVLSALFVGSATLGVLSTAGVTRFGVKFVYAPATSLLPVVVFSTVLFGIAAAGSMAVVTVGLLWDGAMAVVPEAAS
jgi:hypothetical protein